MPSSKIIANPSSVTRPNSMQAFEGTNGKRSEQICRSPLGKTEPRGENGPDHNDAHRQEYDSQRVRPGDRNRVLIFVIPFKAIEIHVLHDIEVVIHAHDGVENANHHEPSQVRLQACGEHQDLCNEPSKGRHPSQ